MHSLTFHESKEHGTLEFPAEYHYVDPNHPRYAMPFHWHKEWEIIHVIQGTFTAYADNVQYTAQSGDVLLIRDGMLHGGTPADCTYECFLFDLHGLFRSLDMVKKYLRPIYRHQILPQICYSCAQNPAVHSIVSELTCPFRQRSGADSQEPPLELITIACIGRLFTYILQEGAFCKNEADTIGNTQRIDLIKSVVEYIESHYSSPITLELLAKEAGMNPKYFCRFFRSITQQTPMDYVNMYRIENAAQLLLETALPITAVGMECGFRETSHFIKVFRKYKGMTPNQYRKQ